MLGGSEGIGGLPFEDYAVAVFAVRRGGKLNLQPKLGRTIGVESCINDPMAVILTTAVIEAILTRQTPCARAAVDAGVQLLVGAGTGSACS